jgi:hypothetical protein
MHPVAEGENKGSRRKNSLAAFSILFQKSSTLLLCGLMRHT